MQRHLPLSVPTQAEVFAVEPDRVQLSLRGLSHGPATIRCRDTEVEVVVDADAIVVDIGNLPASTEVTISVEPSDGSAFTLAARTSTPPPGELLSRFATMSDLHLGSYKFGLIFRAQEKPAPKVEHPMRCALAASREAVAWGAEHLLLKGDLTHHTTAVEWPMLDELVSTFAVPYSFTLGNHDRQPKKKGIPTEKGMANVGLDFQPVSSVDLDGIRLLLADTSIPDKGHGRTRDIVDEVCERMAATDLPVFVGLHHNLENLPLPWFWPPGVPQSQSRVFLDSVKAANPRLMISSGHSHRNRAYVRQGVLITEVGSPKDYPGVWAGYSVYEGGITQTVRRVAAPDALRWTDRTRKAVGGVWGMWAPGYRDQRCITHHW